MGWRVEPLFPKTHTKKGLLKFRIKNLNCFWNVENVTSEHRSEVQPSGVMLVGSLSTHYYTKNPTDFLLYTKSCSDILFIQRVGPTFSTNKKSVRFFVSTKILSDFLFMHKQVSPTFCIKQWVHFFCINKKNRNDFWYMLELHKSYIFVQGKIKNGTKIQTKKSDRLLVYTKNRKHNFL